MAGTEAELQRSKLLAMRVPGDLYRALERDAAALGVSMSDVGRMRLLVLALSRLRPCKPAAASRMAGRDRNEVGIRLQPRPFR
jgi:hypothetical protein